MEIEYKGAGSVTIKAGAANVVVDPKLSHVGLKDLKVSGVIELATDPQFAVKADEKILISGPGEYEVSDISIKGVRAQRHIDEKDTHKATMYSLEIAGFKVAITGHIAEPLSEDQLESLGIVGVLIVPVGGNGYTLDAQGAANVIRQIDPKIVIPVHYGDSGVKYEVPQDKLDEFLAKLGATEHQVLDKLKLKPGSLLPEVLTVVELKRT